MKPLLLIISLVITAPGLPASAQTPECLELSEQLLDELDGEAGPTASMDAMAETQRSILLSRGCDPQQTGYNLEVESMKLNQELDSRPRKKQPFRLDKLLQIRY